MVKSEVGEDFVVFCPHCNYAANAEKAVIQLEKQPEEEKCSKQKIDTKDAKTIEEVSQFLNISSKKLVKTLIYISDKKPVAVLLRGDREVQEVKLANELNALEVRLASSEEVKELLNCNTGFVGPVGLELPILADVEVEHMFNFVTGANEEKTHFMNVNVDDFKVLKFADIKAAQEKDACSRCGNPLSLMKGIEVGHIFELGTAYSERFNLTVLDENGKDSIVYMGSYGIGLGRTMAAIVEQLSDEKGIVWPDAVAPFAACLMAVNQKDETQVNLIENLYNDLKLTNLDVLLDDRKLSFGARMKDAELIGVPYIIIAGKRANEGIFEFVDRKTGAKSEVTKEDLFKK
jgi:prolyl-tRNA synthetase